MIVRIWRGRAAAENAAAYAAHVTTAVFPALTALPGYRGANLLQREVAGEVEFLAVTRWDSLDAIRAFTGDDIDVAVVEPAATAVLSEFDPFVSHYELAYSDEEAH